MKKLLFGLIATVLFSVAGNAHNFKSPIEICKKIESLGKKHLEGSFDLSGGCHVSYSVDIEYHLLPPGIDSIHGSVSMSGNCSGTQSFRGSAKTDEKGTVISADTNLTDKNLQSNEFKEKFVKMLNDSKIFSEK